MRHRKKINHLGRTSAHRKALMANLSCQLIEHKRIITTTAKAKALRVFVEPLITKSKNDTTQNRRLTFDYLHDKHAVAELFGPISEKVGDRPGGYTRIIKLAPRQGDAAEMALIELVDFNTTYVKADKSGAKKTRRSRRRTKDSSVEKNTETTEEIKEETVENVVAKTEETVEDVVETEAENAEETPQAETDQNTTDENSSENTDNNTEEQA